MHIKITRKIIDERGILKIELGRYWEIFVTGRMVEDLVGLNTYNKGVKDMDEPRFDVKRGLTRSREFIKLLKDGDIIPFWYGYAYYNFDCEMTAYMPVPFNFMMAAARWLQRKWYDFKRTARYFNRKDEALKRRMREYINDLSVIQDRMFYEANPDETMYYRSKLDEIMNMLNTRWREFR